MLITAGEYFDFVCRAAASSNKSIKPTCEHAHFLELASTLCRAPSWLLNRLASGLSRSLSSKIKTLHQPNMTTLEL